MSRSALIAWIGMMAFLGVVLVVLGITRSQPVLLIVGVLFLGAQALKWKLLQGDDASER